MGYSLVVNDTITGDTNGSQWTNISSNSSLQAALETAIENAVTQTLKNQGILSSSQTITFTPASSPANPIKTT